MINVYVKGTPVPQGAVRYGKHGRGYHANGGRLKPWRSAVAEEAACSYNGDPISGPVGIELTFVMPRGKTVKREHPSVRPDLSHLIRAVEDALTGVVYKDDSQIVEITAFMVYEDEYEEPGVSISVWTI